MTWTADAEHLVLLRPNYVTVTSSTDAPGMMTLHRTHLGVETSPGPHDIPAPSSTKWTLTSETIEKELQQLCNEYRYDVFEDGIESDFSRRLVRMVETGGNMVLLELNALLRSPSTSPNVSAEALRWLGLMRHRETHAYRRWILTDLLKASSVLTRDGAIVGLLNLDDPSIKHAVQAARDLERSEQLREDLSQLLEQLEMPEQRYALFIEENS